MEDTGWRKNKYGGWFNINDINNNKPQRYTVVHKTKIGEEVGENYGTLEEGIDYYKRFFNNSRAYELQDEKGNKVDVNQYMNDKIRNVKNTNYKKRKNGLE